MGRFVDNVSALSWFKKHHPMAYAYQGQSSLSNEHIIDSCGFTMRFIHRIYSTFYIPTGLFSLLLSFNIFSSRDSFCIFITKPVSLEYHLRLSLFLDHAEPSNLPLAERPPDIWLARE